MKLSRRRFFGWLGTGIVAGATYACRFEPTWLSVVERGVPLARLHPVFDGYAVAQLSDLHVGCGVSTDHLRDAVAAANAAEPDLAVVTGDLVDACDGPAAAAEAAKILGELRARDGVLAVYGNHDTGATHPGLPVKREAMARLDAALAAAGVKVLLNQDFVVRRDGARLRVVGMGDLWSGLFRPDEIAIHDPGALNLVLSHNPDTATELAKRRADLVLSGHTHGGQVWIPFLGAPYVPIEDKRFVRGAFRLDDTQLYVNPGVGYTTQRVRFCARPEVTIHRLRSV